MHIKVGTKNKAKVGAVEEILADYPHLKDAVVEGVEVSSGVADQPKSLEETIAGAENRAKAAFVDCAYAIGIESGLMAVPRTKSGFMDVCVCAIYDGSELHLGLSSGWEFPDPTIITKHMIAEGLNLTEAANKAGLTNNPSIGSGEGIINTLTKGRMDRKEYTKQALLTALIHIDPL
ncbi:MAG: inosine/xanthosine triphosphatase [Minisyncoccia bacterium]